MTDQELLEMFIQERVNMLLVQLNKTKQTESEAEEQRFLQAEQIIEDLPDDERILIQDYIERFTDIMAIEEPYLYKQGFIDGLKVFQYLQKL